MPTLFVSDQKIAMTSSKGNQEKWTDGGRWYKVDQFGYEGLAETVVSRLLERSNVEESGFRFVSYRMERMNVHGRERTGCSSENFLRPGQAIVTLGHLIKRADPETQGKLSSGRLGLRKRMEHLAGFTAEMTGLKEFARYLALLLEIDALFLNEDRHLNNVAVLSCSGAYDYCPIFDNGASLLSNLQTAPADIVPSALISTARARPFLTTFNRQTAAARELAGPQLRMPRLSREEICEELSPLLPYYPERDRGLITDRVCQTILERQRYVL